MFTDGFLGFFIDGAIIGGAYWFGQRNGEAAALKRLEEDKRNREFEMLKLELAKLKRELDK